MAKEIHYVQLQAAKFLTDRDYQRMGLKEKGLYTYLIFLLYDEGGRLRFDPEEIADLLKVDVDDLKATWATIRCKFQIRGNIIRHKTVTEKLTQAQKRSDDARHAALTKHHGKGYDMGGAVPPQCDSNAPAVPPQSEGSATALPNKSKVSESKRNKNKENPDSIPLPLITDKPEGEKIEEVDLPSLLHSLRIKTGLNSTQSAILRIAGKYFTVEELTEKLGRCGKGTKNDRHREGKFYQILIDDLKEVAEGDDRTLITTLWKNRDKRDKLKPKTDAEITLTQLGVIDEG